MISAVEYVQVPYHVYFYTDTFEAYACLHTYMYTHDNWLHSSGFYNLITLQPYRWLYILTYYTTTFFTFFVCMENVGHLHI